MTGIGWLAAGLRHKIWKDEQMALWNPTRYEKLLDNGPGIPLPQGVTVRFIDPDGNHLRFMDCPVDAEGFVVVEMRLCGPILEKILAIPDMGQYTRTKIEEIIDAASNDIP